LTVGFGAFRIWVGHGFVSLSHWRAALNYERRGLTVHKAAARLC
jgi:hypothetical protein